MECDIIMPRPISPLTASIRYFYTKQGTLPKEWHPFIINKFLSYNPDINIQEFTRKLDRITFISDKVLLQIIMFGGIKREMKVPWITYIKKPKEKAMQYKPILEMIQKHFKWTKTELDSNIPVITNLLEDKETLKKLAIMSGDETLIRRLKLIKKTKEKIKKRPMVNLNKWM